MNHPSSVLNWMENENQRYTLEDCFWNIWWKNPASGCYIAVTFYQSKLFRNKNLFNTTNTEKKLHKKTSLRWKEGSKNPFCSQNPHAPPLISMSMNRTINDKSCGFSLFYLVRMVYAWHQIEINGMFIYFSVNSTFETKKINMAKWCSNFEFEYWIGCWWQWTTTDLNISFSFDGFSFLFVGSVKRLNYKFRICCGNAIQVQRNRNF